MCVCISVYVCLSACVLSACVCVCKCVSKRVYTCVQVCTICAHLCVCVCLCVTVSAQVCVCVLVCVWGAGRPTRPQQLAPELVTLTVFLLGATGSRAPAGPRVGGAWGWRPECRGAALWRRSSPPPTLGPQDGVLNLQGLADRPHFCTPSGPTSASPQPQEGTCIFKN